MLLPYLSILKNKIIILGSQSKSRNQLMTAQKIIYSVIPSKFQENLDKLSYTNPSDYNYDTCKGKVEELINRFKKQQRDWDLLICGDTIVQYNGQIIQKPENQQHCIKMMSNLSGKTHRIFTAHAVIFNPQKYDRPFKDDLWVQSAEVTFGQIPIEVLNEFAKHPEPYLHSGGYELTAMSGSFLASIKGSHSAVQGLDMYQICSRIIQGGKKLKWF